MTYQVLARKWRPRIFAEMVGQDHVVKALVNALDNDRLHHAFLFTGTRGVGKTTIARILAKSLNCERGVSSTPCGECTTCREVDEGRFVDLIEVDAASRTKVEDTRELMDNVQYAPTRGRYKVYLVDEVHMLSTHSFNALLKTLEEPPPHVKFLLATTDPQKVPPTVLSRCLQFALKRLPAEMIAAYLEKILAAESVAAESVAVARVARAADGSMRDALSLLDQAIAFGGGALHDQEVRSMLGTIDHAHVYRLLDAVAGGDGESLLAEVARLSEQAPDFDSVLAEMISLLQRIALAQIVPAAIDDGQGDREQVMALAERITPEDAQLYYQIALIGRRDLALSPDPRGGFEMVLLRMLAFRPQTGDGARVADAPPGAAAAASGSGMKGAAVAEGATAASATPPAAPQRQKRQMAPPERAAGGETPETPAVAGAGTGYPESNAQWNRLLDDLPVSGMVRELAMHCAWVGREGGSILLRLDRSREQLRGDAREARLAEALQAHFGEAVKIRIAVDDHGGETPAATRERDAAARQAEAEAALAADPNVQTLQDTFGAEFRPGATRPVDAPG